QVETVTSHNVIGRLAATAPAAERLPGAIVIGGHLDHLGYGGRGSFEPDRREIHNGADDNASGIAALLEAARRLAAHAESEPATLRRDVLIVAFTGEELGLLGSTALLREPPAGFDADGLIAMLNLDMVGRLRDNRLAALGAGSSDAWSTIVPAACDGVRVGCTLGGDGFGPSDQTPFYAAGVPVLHLFSGTHNLYHRPEDDAYTINGAGLARVAALTADLTRDLAARVEPPDHRQVAPPPPQGDSRSYGASLGTIPDYADGKPGVLLSGVRADGPAAQAGLRRGDRLVRLAGKAIGDIYDFMFVLRQHRPGDEAEAVIERGGEALTVPITFGTARGMMR
ncbi:MAG: M28 family peptidase, partial [Pseudomonadota bacterium]